MPLQLYFTVQVVTKKRGAVVSNYYLPAEKSLAEKPGQMPESRVAARCLELVSAKRVAKGVTGITTGVGPRTRRGAAEGPGPSSCS
jgi:hypothetical protein